MSIQEVAPGTGLYVIAYDAGPIDANCVVFRLEGNQIAVLSPPNSDQFFNEVDNLGEVAVLIAPSAGHDLGQKVWQERFPDAAVYGPTEALVKLNKLGLRTFAPVSDLKTPEGLTVTEAPGTKAGSVLVIDARGDRPAMYLDELVFNGNEVPRSLMYRFLFWMTGTPPALTINNCYVRFFTHDKAAIATAILNNLRQNSVVVCAHGDPIEEEATVAKVREMLQAVAR